MQAFRYGLALLAGLMPIVAASAEPANLSRFLQTSASATHVAAAVATVEAFGCSVPLTFREEPGRQDDEIVLTIACDEPDNAYAMLVFFTISEDGRLWFSNMFTVP